MKKLFLTILFILIFQFGTSSAATLHLGYDVVGGAHLAIGDSSVTNVYMNAYKMGATAGTLDSLVVRGRANWNGNDVVLIFIYTDSTTTNYPADLVDSARVLINNDNSAWYQVEGNGAALAANDTFWVGVMTLSQTTVGIGYDANAVPELHCHDYYELEDPANCGAVNPASNQFSVYVVYTEVGAAAGQVIIVK